MCFVPCDIAGYLAAVSLTFHLSVVGVTGSGKGMTAVAAPQKHKFSAEDGEPSSLQCVLLASSIHPLSAD